MPFNFPSLTGVESAFRSVAIEAFPTLTFTGPQPQPSVFQSVPDLTSTQAHDLIEETRSALIELAEELELSAPTAPSSNPMLAIFAGALEVIGASAFGPSVDWSTQPTGEALAAVPNIDPTTEMKAAQEIRDSITVVIAIVAVQQAINAASVVPVSAVISGPTSVTQNSITVFDMQVAFSDGSTATESADVAWTVGGGGSFTGNAYTAPGTTGSVTIGGAFSSNGATVNATLVVSIT